MDKKREKKISKSLSYWLRHNPDAIGITLDENGWTNVGELIEKAEQKVEFDIDDLWHVVNNNDKQRFSMKQEKMVEEGEMVLDSDFVIRANQGHSIKDEDGNSLIDLELEEVVPPQILYHGAPVGVVGAIMKEGLKKMRRHHVHLSLDEETAATVGGRRGKFEILQIEAMKLRADGHKIYISDNGVYLVDEVPPEYIKRQGEK